VLVTPDEYEEIIQQQQSSDGDLDTETELLEVIEET
jgi:hypothetical protein